MIIKSTVRGNGGQLAHYLLNDKKNDRAELVEMRGWTAATLRNALRMSEAIAHGKTHCEKPFYHVSFLFLFSHPFLFTLRGGTGSYPEGPRGRQRIRRRRVSQLPLKKPCVFSASMQYAEQEGSKRQQLPSMGDRVT